MDVREVTLRTRVGADEEGIGVRTISGPEGNSRSRMKRRYAHLVVASWTAGHCHRMTWRGTWVAGTWDV